MPKYDLAVIGAGLGGLAAAALASKSGKKTIVFEPGDSIKASLGAFTTNGFTFYPGPTLTFGFERGGALQHLNENLGIAQKALARSPCYQVVLPDRRVTIYAEQSETLQELSREFPGDIDKITRCYRELRKQGVQNSKSNLSAFLSSRRSARRYISSFRFSREFLTFLDVQSFYFFDRPVAALSQQFLITLIDSAPFTVPSGFVNIAEQIVDVLLKNRGEIRYQAPLSGITLGGRGITTAEGPIEADTILLNTQLNPQESIVCMGIREEVLPVGMLSEVLCVSDYARPGSFYTLSISEKDDENRAPKGMRAVAASFSRSLENSIEQRLQHVSGPIPFLKDFLVFKEKYSQIPREFNAPKNITWKPVWMANSERLLSRSSMRRIYMLCDQAGTPLQAVTAARKFIERIG